MYLAESRCTEAPRRIADRGRVLLEIRLVSFATEHRTSYECWAETDRVFRKLLVNTRSVRGSGRCDSSKFSSLLTHTFINRIVL